MRAHPHPDAIADCVLTAFHALPQKFKPRRLADGRREWVPLAGIVASSQQTDPKSELKCVSLATGMKCLPRSKVQTAKGCILHDSHAEVLAVRGFNRWLVDECAELARKGFGAGVDGYGEWVRWRQRREDLAIGFEKEHTSEGVQEPPFELQDGVELHMYCSEAPCGDASMELVMREQEDDTPWDRTPPAPASDEPGGAEESMLGRGYFDRLGIVRRKPARPDAPVTLSKSCSDKLALKQCTGLLSGLTAKLVRSEATWLSSLTLPEGRIVDEAVERAFGPTGRMVPLADEAEQDRWRVWGYEFKPFKVQTTSKDFEYSKHDHDLRTDFKTDVTAPPVPSNLATLVTPHRSEILINCVLQGRKQDDPRGASCVSRRRMWEAVRDVHAELGVDDGTGNRFLGTYAEAKVVEERERVKAEARDLALKGWKRNLGDEEWGLDDG